MSEKRTICDFVEGEYSHSKSRRCLHHGIKTVEIFELAEEGNLEEFKEFHGDLMTKNENHETYLIKVLLQCTSTQESTKRLPIIKYLLDKAPQLIHETIDYGTTALSIAIKAGASVTIIEHLLKANPQAVTACGNLDRKPMNELVFMPGVSPDDPEEKQKMTTNRFIKIAKLLLQNGADINALDCGGLGPPPLHYFLSSSKCEHEKYNKQIIEFLIQNGAKLLSENGKHVLRYVCCGSIANFLLNKDENDEKNSADKYGVNALEYRLTERDRNDDVIKVMIERGCIVTKDKDPIEIAVRNSHNFEIIALLLKKNPNYDINKTFVTGTLLTKYSTSVLNVETLLKLGADTSITDSSGNTALFTAVKTTDIPTIKKLIEVGLDPLITNKNGDNIMTYLCNYLFSTGYDNPSYCQKYDVLEYLLTLKQFSDPSIKHEKNPLHFILSKFYSELSSNTRNAIEVLTLLIEKSNYELILEPQTTSIHNIPKYDIIFGDYKMDILSFILSTSNSKDKYSTQYDFNYFTGGTYDLVNKILQHGFQVSNTPEDQITPLTALMTTIFDVDDEYDYEIIDLTEKFISGGVNVESKLLKIDTIWVANENRYDYFYKPINHYSINELKETFWLPDALFLAFLTKRHDVVDLLLPYWWGPPLGLLAFNSALLVSDLNEWFPRLAKYGGVPHGTKLFHKVQKWSTSHKWECWKNRDGLNSKNERQFQKFTSSPLSLLELSKYALRFSLAPRASKPDANLPDLLEKVCEVIDLPACNIDTLVSNVVES